MNSLSKGVWQYAVLLVILFAIASIAAYTTIAYLEAQISEAFPEVIRAASVMIWALTMGFMLIAGAFGLWAMQFFAESESRQRLSEIVTNMDYLNDGLLVVDRKGRITGNNPALATVLQPDLPKTPSLQEAFPCLKPDDIPLLIDLDGPNEVQRDSFSPDGRQTLRFRSQSAGGLRLILVSDVTVVREQQVREHQIARFELIGRIVRGAANDFNSILSGISGHASLLPRLDPGSEDMKRSLAAIIKESGNGALLAGHLLEFSHMSPVGRPTDELGAHVAKAADLIRVGLSPSWNVEMSADDDFPVVPLSGVQIEQAVLQLGLAAADALTKVGNVQITANRPNSEDHLLNVGDDFAAVITVSAGMSGAKAALGDLPDHQVQTSDGVIHSVIGSIIEQAGGSLDILSNTPDSQIYRISLPYGHVNVDADESPELADELLSYVAKWHVLLARPTRDHDYVEEKLRDINVHVHRVDSVMAALSHVDDGEGLHAIVVEKDLLGDEANGLLKAIVKLCPKAGIVVLCEDPETEPDDLKSSIVFESRRADPNAIVKAMVEARGIAAHRR
jgi:nitrogen-specific signal transduction histidine kinase